MFSKACEYGIRASIYIALRSMEGERTNLKEIATEIDSPIAFTAKILQQLAKSGIIGSVKGVAGGFEIERSRVKDITLGAIVRAIDGDRVLKGCGLGLKECNDTRPCPVHDKFVVIRNGLVHELENTNLHELATGLEMGSTYLKR